MNTLTLESLLELMSTSPNKTALEVLEAWKSSYDHSVVVRQQQAEEEAKLNETTYGLSRYEDAVLMVGGSEEYRKTRLPKEITAVKQSHLSSFAREHDMSLANLTLLIQGDIAELNRWRSYDNARWSASKAYRDRTADIKEREELLAEDQRELERANARRILASSAVSPRDDFPNYSTYRPKE
jgi:hypothetical protein